MVIIDSTVWIDYFQGVRNPETDWLDTEPERQRLALTDIILCEVQAACDTSLPRDRTPGNAGDHAAISTMDVGLRA